MSRKGVVVRNPYNRLTAEQVELVHRTSLALLEKPGILFYNREAVGMLEKAGASSTPTREGEHEAWWVSIPPRVVEQVLETVPHKITLGARDPEHSLQLDTEEMRVHFGSGSETNIWLEVHPETFVSQDNPQNKRVFPAITRRRGTVADLCVSAHLAENLENLDFFLRNVNVQDKDITEENKDVNKFFASLNNTSKHVMGGLTDFRQLDNVVKMAEIIAGGREALKENPLVSFITSVIKSPLQVVDETAEKLMAVSRMGLPVIISTSPQGGSTAPIDEAGMVAQVNAEVLTGVIINQLAAPGAPVIYGAVPVRARMDNLHDMYGVPELFHYNACCAQMAKHYGIPCYSTAGVGDSKVPGMQAAAEKMLTHSTVPLAAPGLIHYSFGLLEKTMTFSVEQALLDNHHIGMAKFLCREPEVSTETMEEQKDIINKVMNSPNRLYARYARRALRRGGIFPNYPFQGDLEDQDDTLLEAHAQVQKLLSNPPNHLSQEICKEIFDRVPGLLARLNPYAE